MAILIKDFFDADTSTYSFIVADQTSKACAIIDSVLNYDLSSGKISTKSADQLVDFITTNGFIPEWILETHIHADHLTAAAYLKEKFPTAKTAINAKIKNVLKFWAEIFNDHDTKLDGSQFDVLLEDGQVFQIGTLNCKVIQVSGHTPACTIYNIENNLFVGDVIFMPDVGTARTDFPGGSAKEAYDSLQKILSFPDETKIYCGHDYPTAGRKENCVSTVGEQKKNNILINEKISKEEFIENRSKRDVGKAVPKLLLPSIQVNIRAGKLPKPENNGISYIKIPVNKF